LSMRLAKDAEKTINGINVKLNHGWWKFNIKAAQDEIAALVLESGLSAEELASAANGGNGNDNVWY
jgi:hypothetical protein